MPGSARGHQSGREGLIERGQPDMPVVGLISKLAENVVGRTVHAVIHPIDTAAGVARGAASIIAGKPERTHEEDRWIPSQPAERVAAEPDLAPPPAESESFATEPKAPSRGAEHGGPGEDEVADWEAELDEAPDLSVGEQPQPDTEPLMDPSLTKKIKAEAETLERAADTDKE